MDHVDSSAGDPASPATHCATPLGRSNTTADNYRLYVSIRPATLGRERRTPVLRKGTGSELMPEYATEKRSRRGAYTLFQEAPKARAASQSVISAGPLRERVPQPRRGPSYAEERARRHACGACSPRAIKLAALQSMTAGRSVERGLRIFCLVTKRHTGREARCPRVTPPTDKKAAVAWVARAAAVARRLVPAHSAFALLVAKNGVIDLSL